MSDDGDAVILAVAADKKRCGVYSLRSGEVVGARPRCPPPVSARGSLFTHDDN